MRLVTWLLLFISAPVAAQSVQLQTGEILLKVEAEGVVRTAPDRATFDAAVVTSGTTALDAIGANNVLANRLIDALRGENVPIVTIETRRVSVEPRYRDDRNIRAPSDVEIVGYVASNRVTVMLDELEHIPAVYALMSENGANDIDGPQLSLANPEAALREARARAVEAARLEAEDYASAFGMRVGRVLQASERNPQFESSNAIIVTASRIAPFAIGEIETSVELWVDYALER
ncbi:SIMPL domain-containing protein [Parasphingopyxis algicola]|uniref:SIMPL domain-containing protein n=1 Tax=Parasphingopyxis algicola TaxID=2026624 RepID=UPI0015A4A728|nr:SIMPL domain-containing protein [Parasphingopyxis algicola]QLC24273.1 SIMPL domain-containing protein [Parasphingopyxis algicola]